MSELRVYTVEVNGWPTTVQLSESDAAARGLSDKDLADEQPPTKGRTPANKSRTAANKGA